MTREIPFWGNFWKILKGNAGHWKKGDMISVWPLWMLQIRRERRTIRCRKWSAMAVIFCASIWQTGRIRRRSLQPRRNTIFPLYFLTGNLWKKTWCSGISYIMSEQKQNNPDRCRDSLQQIISKNIRMWTVIMMERSSMWYLRGKWGIRMPLLERKALRRAWKNRGLHWKNWVIRLQTGIVCRHRTVWYSWSDNITTGWKLFLPIMMQWHSVLWMLMKSSGIRKQTGRYFLE